MFNKFALKYTSLIRCTTLQRSKMIYSWEFRFYLERGGKSLTGRNLLGMPYNHQQSIRILQVVYKLQTLFPLASSRCIFPVFLSASLKMAWGPLLFIYWEQSPKSHFPSSRVPNWTVSLVSTLLSFETDSLNSRQKQLSKMQISWGPSIFTSF